MLEPKLLSSWYDYCTWHSEKNLFAYQTNFSQQRPKSERSNFQRLTVMGVLWYLECIETRNCHFDEYPIFDSLTFWNLSGIFIIGTAAEQSSTEKNSRWCSNSTHGSAETKQSRQAQMQNSPAGANTNRKLGIAALQIRDLSSTMHRLAEGCRPYTMPTT